MSDTLMAGVGRIEVTPEMGVRLGGYGVKERPAETVNDPLNATALTLSKRGVEAVLINLDWLGMNEEDVITLRAAITAATGVSGENVIVTTIHSHTTPNTISIPGWGDKEKAYIDDTIPKIVESVVQARENLKPVKVGIGTTSSDVGVNRCVVTEENGVAMIGDVDGAYDPTMTVIRFESEDGVMAALIHYGAHATAFGCPRIVSRDWPGIMIDRVESQINAPAMFVNGPIGDVGPRTNQLKNGGFSAGTGDGLEAVREVGYRGATDALRAFVGIREFRDDFDVNVATGDILFPYDPLPSLEVAEEKLREYEPTKDEFGRPMFEYVRWQRIRDALTSGNVEGGHVYKQTIIQLGPVAFVPFPGEVFTGITLRLRRGSPFQHTLCSSVSNGYYTYIPTREATHRGGYAMWMAKAFDGYGMIDDIDDILVAENLKLLRGLTEK